MSKMSIYVWLPTYPDVMSSLLIAFRKHYQGNACIICPKPITTADKERYKFTGIEEWFQIITVNQQFEYEAIANSIFKTQPDAIHLFGGFFSYPGIALSLYCTRYNGKHAYVFTEKPSIRPKKHLNSINRLIRNAYAMHNYMKAYNVASSAIKAIFVTGQKGVDQFKHFGIPEKILFEIMYTHNDGSKPIEFRSDMANRPVSFVYVGRFDYLNRGLDILIAAFSKLKTGGWNLDLVGGYGTDAKEVIEWCNTTPNVRFLGEWNNYEVIKKLSEYDVCISPTRIDGWRIQVNQAIIAGIGTITTTEAISDELIDLSKTGIVIPPNNVKALKRAIEYTLTHQDTIQKWKTNAKIFKDRISNELVGQYMYDVICFSENGQGRRPQCPWKVLR